MGIFDGILGQLGNLDELAAKFGLPADTVKAFTEELPARLQAGGNPIEIMTELAAKHGISAETMQGMMNHFGASTANLMAMFGKEGDANPFGELGNIAKGMFGGN